MRLGASTSVPNAAALCAWFAPLAGVPGDAAVVIIGVDRFANTYGRLRDAKEAAELAGKTYGNDRLLPSTDLAGCRCGCHARRANFHLVIFVVTAKQCQGNGVGSQSQMRLQLCLSAGRDFATECGVEDSADVGALFERCEFVGFRVGRTGLFVTLREKSRLKLRFDAAKLAS